jgi:4-amino-4-deoxy-L-arabinose transferase-like glycosyltransferase
MSLATVLRLWYVTVLPGQGGNDVLISDMATYDLTGWSMAHGLPVSGQPGLNGYHPLSASTYYFAGYTYFLAALYFLFGHNLAAVRIAQAVVGGATVGVVYLVGSFCFNRRAGLVAAILTAVHLPLVYYTGLVLTETWFIFLQMTALALWLRSWSNGFGREPKAVMSLLLAAAAGMVGGMACLSRAAFVLTCLMLAAGGLFAPPVTAPLSRRVGLVAAFLLSAAIVIAPVTVRNYQIHGRFILISTNGPSTFLTGHVTHDPFLPTDLPPGTTDAQMADMHWTRSMRYLANHWDTYVAEIPEFFEIIWTDDDFWPGTFRTFRRTPDSGRARMDVRIYPRGSPPFGQATYFPDLVRYSDRLVWCLIGLPMGLLALLLRPRDDRRWTVAALAVVPYLVIPFIASAFPRYRIPAVPLVFVLAGHSFVTCSRLRRGRCAIA